MLAKPKLLVVEDSHSFRQVISSLLSVTGVDIIGEAADGLEAVRLAQQWKPDVILLDIGLPGLDGINVGRQIRQLCPHSKIVFVSQESATEVVQEAFALGANAYVHKSHAHRDLISAMEAVFKGDKFVSPSLAFDDANVQSPLRHDMLFCSDDALIVESVVRFISTALKAGNPAVVWASAAHRDSILRRLRAEGIDMDSALEAGMYLSIDVGDSFSRTLMLEMIEGLAVAASSLGKKHPRVALYGERSGWLWAKGKADEAIKLEQLGSQIAKSHNVDCLCLYPTPDTLKDPALDNICSEHTRVYSLP